MERLISNHLKGAKAYFTTFDHRIVNSYYNKTVLQKKVERALKILLLTKNYVVCAASHLTSDFTYNFLKDNPILLNEGLLIPALRNDKKGINELFINLSSKEKKDDMISFYDSNISKTVGWELSENSNWFKDTLLSGLRNETSVIRRNLTLSPEDNILSFIEKIEQIDVLSREKIERSLSMFSEEEKNIIRNYRELIYHVSGSRVVECESTLPQENYIEYSLADIKNRNILLSDVEIFWKIFIEIIYESFNRIMIPIDYLDYLTFEEIAIIRQSIHESNFIENYEKLINKSVQVFQPSDKNDLLYDLNELMTIKEELEGHMRNHIEDEFSRYLSNRVKTSSKNLLKNTVNIALGFIPISSMISGSINAINEIKPLYFNLSQGISSAKSKKNHQYYFTRREKLLEKMITNFEINEKTSLIDTVRLLIETITEKQKLS